MQKIKGKSQRIRKGRKWYNKIQGINKYKRTKSYDATMEIEPIVRSVMHTTGKSVT